MTTHAIDWKLLSKTLQKEPDLLRARITPESLMERHDQGCLAVMHSEHGLVQAISALWDVESHPEWMELGTLWVAPEYRGNGYSRDIFRECVKIGRSRGVNLFLITRKPDVIALATKSGWSVERRLWTEVDLWKNICRPWDRYPETGNAFQKQGTLCFLPK